MNPPSGDARELVRGGVDLHLHIAPDVIERRIDDVSLARRFEEVGLAGFVLKSHYVPTAERAAVVRGVVPGIQVMGALALNRSVGGMNPLAVEIAGREGARMVWFPTSTPRTRRPGAPSRSPGAKLPAWAKMQHELRALGAAVEPVAVVDEDGAVLPETRTGARRRSPRHGMLLATGHLGRDEIFAVVDAAVEEGVLDIVVTHPEFPSQDLSVEDQIELARRGAFLERCFTTPAHRQVHVGALAGGHARGRPGVHGALDRHGPAGQPAGRGRAAADGREAAGGGVLRGRGEDDGGRQHAEAGPPMTLLLAIGAHAADFVWRAGGALAVAAEKGEQASVIALSYGERGESGELWKQEGQTIDNVKRIRHGEAEAAAAALGADFRCLDLGDYPLEVQGEALDTLVDAIREIAPDTIVTHTDTDPFNPDHPVAFHAVQRARALAAGAGVEQRVRDHPGAEAVPVRAPPARAVQLHADHVRRHHAGDREEAGGDGRDEGPEVPAHLLRAARRAARQPRAPGLGRQRDPLCRGVPARAAAGGAMTRSL